ncbi:MAG: hypothetical protein MUP81_02955, partial [Dehalococcoidia bacterium]|nr:hypothetical protein [Dehalococcoidia bacterium]
MAKPKEGLTEKFTSFLSFKLGAYQGLGLYENYPTNFNKLMPKFATDLLAQLHALGYKSPDEIPAIERVAMERGKEECAKTHFKPDWKIGAQEIKDATEEGVRAGILIGGADKVPDMIKEVERAAME